MFPFEPDLISDGVLFFYCSVAFCVFVDGVDCLHLSFHQFLDALFHRFIV